MKIVDVNNKTTIDSKDLMKIFKERQLAVKISNEYEYDTFIEMAKEAGFDIPEGLCFEDIKKRPCLHLSQLIPNRVLCDDEEWCREEVFIRPYKIVSYDEFIHMRCEPEVVTPDKFSAFTSAPVKKPSLDFGKLLHQRLVDFNMTDPYDIHISSDGKTTTARFYVNGKLIRTAEANCHPDDRFNFKTGAEVAFDRLFEKQKKEKVDLNNLKTGDKVRVRRDLKAGSWPESILMVMPSMEEIAGRVVTIESVTGPKGHPIYTIKEFEGPWRWTPEMFEEV